jgi:hypothetical protein
MIIEQHLHILFDVLFCLFQIGCAYKNALRRYETPYRLRALVEMNGPTIWDMEDLVKSLTSIKDPICPYFASNRVLNSDADIIFCPFTYMLGKNIVVMD